MNVTFSTANRRPSPFQFERCHSHANGVLRRPPSPKHQRRCFTRRADRPITIPVSGNRVRRAHQALVLSAALALGACGGAGGSDAPAPPAAAVADDADSAVGGPVDRARDVADDLNRRQEQIEQRAGG